MSEIKARLRNLDFPQFAKEAVYQVESWCCSSKSGQLQRAIQELIDEFIFCEIDRRGNRAKKLTAVQEFQLLQVLCDYFENKKNEIARNTLFLHLFHYEGSGSNKMKILSKLVSLSIASKNATVLKCTAVWMQQQGCTSDIVVSLIKDLVNDYFILVPRSASFLNELPQICIHFTSHFVTGATALYNCISPKKEREMPSGLLLLITKWVSSNEQLCFAPLMINLHKCLPQGTIIMPCLNPFAGLIRWCIQAPLLQDLNVGFVASDQESYERSGKIQIYSQLYIGILESMMEVEKHKSELMQEEVISTRDWMSLIDGLHILLSKCTQSPDENNLKLALERLGQTIQMSVATGCFRGNMPDICCHIVNRLPNHRLLNVIVKNYKS